jgi:hypothetical protein
MNGGWLGTQTMPVYYFNLKDVQGIHIDPEGTELPDDAEALEHARQVAQELMQRREARTRAWRLQACDAERNVLFELLFATVDHPMQELHPVLRQTVETVSARTAGLSDAICDVRTSLYQLRGTLAKSDGAPYLAALNGSRIEP